MVSLWWNSLNKESNLTANLWDSRPQSPPLLSCMHTVLCTHSQTGLLLQRGPRSSKKAALMITRCDAVTGAREQSLTPQALPSSHYTYCSLSPTHTHTFTHTTGDWWPTHTEISEPPPLQTLQCLSYYLFLLYLSHRANKAWIRLWDRNISTFIKLSVTVWGGMHAHTEFTPQTKEAWKHDDCSRKRQIGQCWSGKEREEEENKWRGNEMRGDTCWEGSSVQCCKCNRAPAATTQP